MKRRGKDRDAEVKESLLSMNLGCMLIPILVFGVPFVLAGGFFASMGFRSMQNQARLMQVASRVPAVIVSSEKRRLSTSGKRSYRADIQFSYQADEQVRESSKVWPVEEGRYEDEVSALVERFPPGAEVQAFVDPDDPNVAFLEKRWSQMPFISVSVGCLPIIFVSTLIILVAGWRRPKLAMVFGVVVALVVIAATALAGTHYLHRVPGDSRVWWIWLILAGPGIATLAVVVALTKAWRLNRLSNSPVGDS